MAGDVVDINLTSLSKKPTVPSALKVGSDGPAILPVSQIHDLTPASDTIALASYMYTCKSLNDFLF